MVQHPIAHEGRLRQLVDGCTPTELAQLFIGAGYVFRTFFFLNAAFELEGKVVGATNNTRPTAQNIDGSVDCYD